MKERQWLTAQREDHMSKLRIFLVVLASFVSMPIWFYLLYKILVAVNATELMFFLYWVYVPVTFLVSFIAKLFEEDKL
jgi:hypothetical protein